MDKVLSHEFFQLPFLEGLMYLVVLLLIGAASVGLWDRTMVTSPRRTPPRSSQAALLRCADGGGVFSAPAVAREAPAFQARLLAP